MAETETRHTGQTLKTNRIELIHMITNLIHHSDFTVVHTQIEGSVLDEKDRDDAAMLAIHIVDGLEDEAESLRLRMSRRKSGIRMKGNHREHGK